MLASVWLITNYLRVNLFKCLVVEPNKWKYKLANAEPPSCLKTDREPNHFVIYDLSWPAASPATFTYLFNCFLAVCIFMTPAFAAQQLICPCRSMSLISNLQSKQLQEQTSVLLISYWHRYRIILKEIPRLEYIGTSGILLGNLVLYGMDTHKTEDSILLWMLFLWLSFDKFICTGLFD